MKWPYVRNNAYACDEDYCMWYVIEIIIESLGFTAIPDQQNPKIKG